jgi:hypothetical protein
MRLASGVAFPFILSYLGRHVREAKQAVNRWATQSGEFVSLRHVHRSLLWQRERCEKQKDEYVVRFRIGYCFGFAFDAVGARHGESSMGTRAVATGHVAPNPTTDSIWHQRKDIIDYALFRTGK